MTEVLVEAWMTPGVPGMVLMMTGGPEKEEMMKEVEGEAWMTCRAVVVMTLNPGSLWADLVVGVSGRRPGRTAGDLLVVVLVMMEMMMMSVAHKERRVPGEEQVEKKGAAGETLAERTLTMTNAVTVMNATVTAVIETAGRTVKTEPHPEILTREALGVVEVKRSGWRGRGTGPETRSVTVIPMETRAGVLTDEKKTLVAPRMRQMMMAGPLCAAEEKTFASVNDEYILKKTTKKKVA